jgi:large subunit ribosomal protein L24
VRGKKVVGRSKPLFVRKNDTVLILSGEDRGKQGKVLKVFPSKRQIIIEGVNFIRRHTRPSQKNPKGGIVEKEGPINFSNVMVVCSKCGEPTRVGAKIITDGSRLRACKKCGEIIQAA